MSAGRGALPGATRALRPGADRDPGLLSVMTMLIAIVALSACGLIVDGGRALTARRAAADTAEAAARFAVATQSPLADFDEPGAIAAATGFALRSGIGRGDVVVRIHHDALGTPEIVVTIIEHPTAVFLALGGITSMTVRATGVARFVYSS